MKKKKGRRRFQAIKIHLHGAGGMFGHYDSINIQGSRNTVASIPSTCYVLVAQYPFLIYTGKQNNGLKDEHRI